MTKATNNKCNRDKLVRLKKFLQIKFSMFSINDMPKRNDRLKVNGRTKKCIACKTQNLKMQSKLY